MKFTAVTRKAQGTGASRRLRRAEKLPGIVYGGKVAATPIELDHNEIFHALRKEKFHASILEMVLDGKSERVLLRSFQMHPYKPQVLHIDFQRISADEQIRMNVPLHLSVKKNLRLLQLIRLTLTTLSQSFWFPACLISCLNSSQSIFPALLLINLFTFPTSFFRKVSHLS